MKISKASFALILGTVIISLGCRACASYLSGLGVGERKGSTKEMRYLLETIRDDDSSKSSSSSGEDIEESASADVEFPVGNNRLRSLHPQGDARHQEGPQHPLHIHSISKVKGKRKFLKSKSESHFGMKEHTGPESLDMFRKEEEDEGYLQDGSYSSNPESFEEGHEQEENRKKNVKEDENVINNEAMQKKKKVGESVETELSQNVGDLNQNQSPSPELREQQEKLLLRKLMIGYERDVRPVRNASQPVVVRVGITLTQIFDMDEKQQVLTTNVWLDQEWNDELLRWDPKEFGGLETIRLPCERIWLPDVVLYNNADDYTRGYMPSRAMVSHDGNVFWPPPTKFRSTCAVDVTYFPFDDQVCSLKLGSWTYNGYEVDVTNRTPSVDLSNYVSNGEWELLKADQKRNVVFYPCCPEPFLDVTITLVIRRKTLYYIYNIVLPCIMLSALTLLVFCLPPDSGEKIALGITVLLAFSVFMLAINESLPETSESIPLIGVYLTIVMAITSVSVIMTVVVLNLHYLGPQVRPVPRWLIWCLLPKDPGRGRIRQKSLLIPVTHREPRSGSLKRGHIFITQLRGGGNGKGDGFAVEVPPEDRPEDMMTAKNEPPGGGDISVLRSENAGTPNCSLQTGARRHLLPPQAENSPQTSGLQQHQHQQIHSHPQNNVGPSRVQQEEGPTPGISSDADGRMILTENAWNVLQELLASIKLLINKQEDVEIQNNLVAEWRLIAQVVDRILFWLFFIFTVTSSAMILVILPIYKRSWVGSPLKVINVTDADLFEG